MEPHLAGVGATKQEAADSCPPHQNPELAKHPLYARVPQLLVIFIDGLVNG